MNSTDARLFSEYENGCVYLAESAQILTQNTVYEIPAVKKNNQKLEQVQLESDKKEETAGKRILELDEEFRLDARKIFNLGLFTKDYYRSVIQTNYFQVELGFLSLI